jgi:hypothetical protein
MNIQTPAARNTDPDTSHLAAHSVTTTGTRHTNNQKCREAVENNPGASSAKIAKITGLDRHEAARRLSDLRGISVEQGEPVRCKLCNNRLCVTWWPKDEAKWL